jgi:hypothetical protein
MHHLWLVTRGDNSNIDSIINLVVYADKCINDTCSYTVKNLKGHILSWMVKM